MSFFSISALRYHWRLVRIVSFDVQLQKHDDVTHMQTPFREVPGSILGRVIVYTDRKS